MIYSGWEKSHAMLLQSAPIEVRMAGFKATTTSLQSHGWQMSVETHRLFDRDAEEIRVAFKHDGIKQVALGRMQLDSRQIIYQMHNPQAMGEFYKNIGIEISCIAPMIRCHVMPMNSINAFEAVDARPQWLDAKEIDLNEFALFKPIKSENFEIYIHEKEEQEILDLLLKKQNPKQKEIRQNEKRRQYMENNSGFERSDLSDKINGDVKHQIVLYGGAA